MTSMSPALHRYYEGQPNKDNAIHLGISCDLLRVNLMNERRRLNMWPRVVSKSTYELDTSGRFLSRVAVGVMMSKSLTLYYFGFKNAEIAGSLGIHTGTVARSLSRERIKLGLPKYKTRRNPAAGEFDNDKDLVMALREDGMTYRDIADKWGVSRSYAAKMIKYWVPKIEGEVIISSKFEVSDNTLPAEFTVTLNGIPKLKVTRL